MARYLVVDDDPLTVKGLVLLLTDHGHDVTSCTSGADAVNAMSREPFDAVLTNLAMPGVDGRAVVRAARTQQPDACIVVVSARGRGSAANLVDAGTCIVTEKPVELEAVMKAVADCRARGPGAHARCHLRLRRT